MITGPRTVLEDAQGFVAVLSDFADLSALTAELGITYEVDHTSFRPFFGCSLTITASAATAALLRQNPGRRPDDLAQITVRCHPRSIEEVGKPDPVTLLAARLSMEFNVALVLHRGDVVVGDVDDGDLWNLQLRSLLAKVRLIPDESIPLFGSVVDAHFNDGLRAEAKVAWPKGDPELAPMSWDDTIEKFRNLVSGIGAAERFESVIACVSDIEAYDGVELARRIEASILSYSGFWH
jgi:2-methylcitrate dehydratase PrpD